MPAQFNIGRDVSVVLIGPLGRVDLKNVVGFDEKQTTHKVKSRPLAGPPMQADIPDGWSGTIHVERASSVADDALSAAEASFWAGGVLGAWQVYRFVNEVDGSSSTYRYDGCAVSLTDAGTWSADAVVKQTIAFEASTRTRV